MHSLRQTSINPHFPKFQFHMYISSLNFTFSLFIPQSAMATTFIFTFYTLLILSLLLSSSAQPQRRFPSTAFAPEIAQPTYLAPAPAPAPYADLCNGIWLSYKWNSGKKLHPRVSTASNQAFSFKSELNILNNDDVELKSWNVLVGFQHKEILVGLDGGLIANGTMLPALVDDQTIIAGFPQTDLKTGIQTAGDLTQMSVKIKMTGTQFGVKPPGVPWPNNISLVNAGYICPTPFTIGNFTLNTCCFRNPEAESNMTIGDEFSPRENGDLTIMYDVVKAMPGNYLAQVTLANHNQLGRLDHWRLNWEWMADEFIFSMKGAYPDVIDANDCINGPQATLLTGIDFSTVLNCQTRPTIIDLPPSFANDPNLGNVPFCCRNGTILPPGMDDSKSKSSFMVQVYKMPPNMNQSAIVPPRNWKISGILNPDYECGPPMRVSPSEYPSPTGLPVNTTVVASWQVVCNITEPKNTSPKCCVSFSAYFNESVIPCNTCACGCPKTTGRTCSTTAPAMLVPPEAQLVPFDNRTKLALAWADLKHGPVPNPLPCSDNCGVSINWHVNTDYAKGWTAKVTLFNWEEIDFPEWFLAVEMPKAAPGFEKVYTFNGTLMEDVNHNDTIFMQGLPGLNYLMGETNGTKAGDARVPGKQQSVISFTKKTTEGIRVGERDGFPTKVYFNGEECSLPKIYPVNGGYKTSVSAIFPVVLAVLAVIFIHH